MSEEPTPGGVMFLAVGLLIVQVLCFLYAVFS